MISAINIDREIITKIELLCYGLRSNDVVEEIYSIQNPYNQLRTGNIGIQLLIGQNRLPANVPVFNKFTTRSPYTIQKKDSSLIIQKDESSNTTPVYLIETPNWYGLKVANNKKVADYLLNEGRSTIIASITETCAYAIRQSPCAFCAIRSKNTETVLRRKSNLMSALEIVLNRKEYFYQSINLTGGNSVAPDRGIESYKPYVEFIRSRSNVPICLELSPPSDLELLDELVQLGANSFMMNIEIWDEKLRKLFMPAKSIIPRVNYLKAWERAVKLVGIRNVSSVIIIGLENEISVMDAITEMVDIGVIPSIMPLRPNDGAVLENFPTTDPNLVLKMTLEVARKLDQRSITISGSPGCVGCGACAAECDILNNINIF